MTAKTNQQCSDNPPNSQPSGKRRAFLKGLGVAGAALSASPWLGVGAEAEDRKGSLTKGGAAILRLVAAAEIIESDNLVAV